MSEGAAGAINIIVTVKEGAGTSAVANKVNRAIRTITSDSLKMGQTFKRSGEASVSSLQATSAALRLAEGGITNSLRAAERFAARIPGLSSALKTAFPVVGAAALVAVIYRATEGFMKLRDAAIEAPKAMETAMDSAAVSMNTHIDSILLKTAKLQAQMEKLKFGKTTSSTALAIADATQKSSADATVNAITSTSKTIRDGQKKTGFAGQVIGGAEGNTAEISAVNSILDALAKQGAAVARAPAGSVALAAGRAKLMAILSSGIGTLQGMDAQVKTPRVGPVMGYMRGSDISSRTTPLEQAIEDLKLLQVGINAQQKGDQLKATIEHLSKAKKVPDKSVQAQMDAYRTWRSVADRSNAEKFSYWNGRRALTAPGSATNINAGKQAEQAMISVLHENTAGLKEFNKLFSKLAPHVEKMRVDKGAAAWLSNVNVGMPAARYQSDMGYASDRTDLMRRMGMISPHTAAVRRAALNTAAYGMQMAGINTAIGNVQADSSLSVLQKNARVSGLRLQGTQLTGAYTQQHMQDMAAITTTRTLGSLNTALAKFSTQVTDTGTQLTKLSMGALNSSNTALVAAMQGYHGTFKGLGRTLVGQGTTTVLQGAEGMFLRGIGIRGKANKALGTKSNPMFVVDANSPAGKAGATISGALAAIGKHKSIFGTIGHDVLHPKSAMSGIGKMLHGAAGSGGWVSGIAGLFKHGAAGAASGGAGSASGGGWGSAITDIASMFQGGFAAGGSVVGNIPAMVGEKGPEIFVPHTHGTILPNGSFGNQQTIHIDARATNPAMVQSAVHRGMAMAYAGAVQSSLHHVADMSKRRP